MQLKAVGHFSHATDLNKNHVPKRAHNFTSFFSTPFVEGQSWQKIVSSSALSIFSGMGREPALRFPAGRLLFGSFQKHTT